MSRLQHLRAKRIIDLIQKEKKIHKFELIRVIGISISTYEKLKPWLEYTYSHVLRYEKETQQWIFVEKDDDSLNDGHDE